ncbi:BPSS1187 family protein [Pirellulaceae bacterium SH501]
MTVWFLSSPSLLFGTWRRPSCSRAVAASIITLIASVCITAPVDGQEALSYDSKVDGKLYQWKVRSSEIDPEAKEHPEIDFFFEKDGKPADYQNASVDTRVKPTGKLVIWLMGHNGALFERLNSYGHHAIQVHYANGWFKRLNREPPPDDQYLGRIRLEAAIGENVSETVSIPKPDSIMGRTRSLLRWLDQKNPEAKWGHFLDKATGEVRWDRVILAGASHGSTTACRFALHQKVNRVVMLSGPRDQNENWYALPSATPKDRFFGFTHVLDTGWTGNHYPRSWKMLGLDAFGPIVDVDQVPAPFGGSHQLTTNADVKGDKDRAHGVSSPGKSAIKNPDGTFAHEAVWRYLFVE